MRYIAIVIVAFLLFSCGDSGTSPPANPEDNMEGTYAHPKLGELYPEDVDWQTDEVTVPFSNVPIEVCLAEGNDAGPSEAALLGYEWIEGHWQDVLRLIQDQAYDFYEPYAAAVSGVPTFDNPGQLWGTEILLSIRVFSRENFTVTMRFSWQKTEDPHEVTFYVEEGRCGTHSVDG